MMLLRRSARVLVLAALVATLASACSKSAHGPDVASVGGGTGASAAPSPTASGDRTAQLLAFAQCMRDQGVDVKDPQAGTGAGGLAGMGDGIDANDPKVQAAFTVCQSKLPGGGQPPKLNPQQVTLYLQFAQCMRDNGVDVPDPAADGSLNFNAQTIAALQNPATQKALAACRDKLTGLIPSAAAS